jgi:uracil-DNA glycosylase
MTKLKDVKMEASWKEALAQEFEQPYFETLKAFLVQEKEAGKNIYPPSSLIFNAFDLVPLPKVKVVILGQDPYHGAGQAMGLSFSVPKGLAVPASLVNIYKELEQDIPGFVRPKHGDLTHWAEQGVFLLNTVLTVEEKSPNSHKGRGWEQFTDAVIRKLSSAGEGIVFLLWGKPAQAKASLIDAQRHLILQAAHPSPLAGNRFQGCKHFSQANAYLQAQGKTPIDWILA